MTDVLDERGQIIAYRRHLLLPERRDEVLESVVYLRSIPYSEYLQTRWWKFRRESFADGCLRCSCCRTSPSGPLNLPRYHVHHLTYEELGQEPDEHLAYVCSPCHNLIHYPESNAAQYWLLQSGPDLLAKSQAMCP